jgi:hypothetical protein
MGQKPGKARAKEVKELINNVHLISYIIDGQGRKKDPMTCTSLYNNYCFII